MAESPDQQFLILVFVAVLGMVFLGSALKIAAEGERFAVFLLGRFHSYKGPGLVLIVPFTQRIHRLRIGDVGVYSGGGFARFGDVDIPVQDAGALRPEQAVRIDRFDGVEPRIAASPERPQQHCPKCGHRF